MFQSLESRRHLSASLENGILTVIGTDAKDVIRLSSHSHAPGSTPELKQFRITVAVNSDPIPRFIPGSVTQIVIDGGPGGDLITVPPGFLSNIQYDASGDEITRGIHIINSSIAGSGGDDTIICGADDPLVASSEIGEGSRANNTVIGGAGNDLLIGGEGPDILSGSRGRDKLNGNGGFDRLTGGADNDGLSGGGDDDDFSGGGGIDTADYSDRTDPLRIDVDGLANDGRVETPGIDGAPLEHDNVHSDVEVIIGGAGADLLRGDQDSDTLLGLGGNDTLAGTGGDDMLIGGRGRDKLFGGDGNDQLIGVEQPAGSATQVADILYGGGGNDTWDNVSPDVQRDVESIA